MPDFICTLSIFSSVFDTFLDHVDVESLWTYTVSVYSSKALEAQKQRDTNMTPTVIERSVIRKVRTSEFDQGLQPRVTILSNAGWR